MGPSRHCLWCYITLWYLQLPDQFMLNLRSEYRSPFLCILMNNDDNNTWENKMVTLNGIRGSSANQLQIIVIRNQVSYKFDGLFTDDSSSRSQRGVHLQDADDRCSTADEFSLNPTLNKPVVRHEGRLGPDPGLEPDRVVIDDLEVVGAPEAIIIKLFWRI